MGKTIKIVLLVIATMSVGESMDPNEDIVADLRIEMKDMKKDLLATKAELLTTKEEHEMSLQKLERDLLTTKEDLLSTKKDLLTTKEDLLTTKKDLEEKDATIKANVRGLSNLWNPPYTYACGAHYLYWSSSHGTIPYSTLLYSSSNVEGPNGLDINTGVFTAGCAGTYAVTWSLTASDDHGDHYTHIHLRKNGAIIDESRHSSYYTGTSGLVFDQGGRTMWLHLDRGEYVDLYCSDCSAGIYHTTFCVSLGQWDIE